MRRKGYEESDIEETSAKLSEWGYLDDETFAKDLTGEMLRSRGMGRARAAWELKRKLFDPTVVDNALTEVYGDTSEEEYAVLAARGYLAKLKGPLSQKERERLARWLSRRGYGAGAIYHALEHAGRADGEPRQR